MPSQHIKEQISLLVEHQKADVAIFDIQKKLGQIPARLEAMDSRMAALSKEVEAETARIDDMKKDYRRFDAEISANESKMQKSREKLAAVKNNKEYQATLKEIDDIKERNSEIEDRMIERLDLIDAAEAQLKSEQEGLSRMRDEVSAEKKEIEKDREEYGKQLSRLEETRDRIDEKIDPAFMKTFEHSRLNVGLITIAKVNNAVCSGCHMNIPPQKYIELQRCDEVHFCPNCHRIIYWENEDERSE